MWKFYGNVKRKKIDRVYSAIYSMRVYLVERLRLAHMEKTNKWAGAVSDSRISLMDQFTRVQYSFHDQKLPLPTSFPGVSRGLWFEAIFVRCFGFPKIFMRFFGSEHSDH